MWCEQMNVSVRDDIEWRRQIKSNEEKKRKLFSLFEYLVKSLQIE